MRTLGFVFAAAVALSPGPSQDEAARRARLMALFTAQSPADIPTLVAVLRDPALQPVLAARIPYLLGSLIQGRKDKDLPGLSSSEIALLQSLYATKSVPLLQGLLNSDRLLREVPIPTELFSTWFAAPDELSLAALRVASERLDGKALVPLIDSQWDLADAEWRMESVQLSTRGGEYEAWLRRRASGPDDVARRAELMVQLRSQAPGDRKAAVEIVGKSNDPPIMRILVNAMGDPDDSVATAALTTFWEMPRPYTADVMEDMLPLIPKVGLSMRRMIAENLSSILNVIGQQRGQWRLPPLSPADQRFIEPLFSSDDPRILKAMLSSYFFFNGLPLPPQRVLGWIAMPDDISVKALAIATLWVKPADLVASLEQRWKTAGASWKLQAVQLPIGSKEYLAWLNGHQEPGEVGDMARLTLQVQSGLTLEKMSALRRQLTTPGPLRRWASMLPVLGKTGADLALAELEPDGLLTPDIIRSWGAFGLPLPQKTAASLLADRRIAVRAFAADQLNTATPDQARGWCGSELYDVRVVGARFADRSAVEDLLVDDRPEVRLAAIVRWAVEKWPDLDKTLTYGLSDPLLTDNLLLATVRLPQCQAALAAWGAKEPQLSKLNSAKSSAPIHFSPVLPAR